MTTTPSSTPPPLLSSSSLRWPSDRFYWAILDAPGFSRTGPLPPGLLPALADEIPEPLETLHAVCSPIAHSDDSDDSAAPERVLVCCCRSADLDALDPSIIELKPDSLPAELAIPTDTTLPNLLIGDHEPDPIRADRRRRHLRAVVTITLCSLLAALGLIRRARHADLLAAADTRAADALLARTVPDRRESSLERAAAAMRDLAAAAKRTRPPRDAAADLESLLKSWPATTSAKPQSLSAADGLLALSLTLEGAGDPAPFLKSFVPPPAMTLDEPRVANVGGLTRINLQLRPAQRPTP
jgi:hypothetical protein